MQTFPYVAVRQHSVNSSIFVIVALCEQDTKTVNKEIQKIVGTDVSYISAIESAKVLCEYVGYELIRLK